MAKNNNRNHDIETRVDTATAENIETTEDPIVNDPPVETNEAEYAAPAANENIEEEHTESAPEQAPVVDVTVADPVETPVFAPEPETFAPKAEEPTKVDIPTAKVAKGESKGFEIKVLHYIANEDAANEYVQKFVARTGITDVTLEYAEGGFYLFIVGIPTYEEAVKIKRTIIGKGIKATIVK